jgi:hypothetical protein
MRNHLFQVMQLLYFFLRGPFEKFVDWRQCADIIMQSEAVTFAKL